MRWIRVQGKERCVVEVMRTGTEVDKSRRKEMRGTLADKWVPV